MEKDFTLEKLGVNPYRGAIKIRVTEVLSQTEFTKDNDGELCKKRYYIEKDKSSKLYKVAGLPELTDRMTPKAQRLFLYMLVRIETNKEYFSLNTKHYMRTNGVKSMRTVNDAIKELLHNNIIIATSVRYVFFVNPTVMFSGDRLKHFPDNIEVVNSINGK